MEDISKMLSVLAVVGLVFVGLGPRPIEAPNLVQPVGLIEIFKPENPLRPFNKGTGVFVSPTQILTAAHVVEDSNKDTINKVRMENGDTYNIVDFKKSEEMDIGILTVDRPYKGRIPTFSCEPQDRGTELTTLGNPLIMEFLESKIIVAGGKPSRYVNQEEAKPPEEPQKSATKNKRFKVIPPDKVGPPIIDIKPANLTGTTFFQGVALPGQSGSPVYDKDGKIVGVVAVTVLDGNSGSYSGIGMYVEASKACKFLKENIKNRT